MQNLNGQSFLIFLKINNQSEETLTYNQEVVFLFWPVEARIRLNKVDSFFFKSYKIKKKKKKKKSNMSLIEDSLKIILMNKMWNFDNALMHGFFVKVLILEKKKKKKKKKKTLT